MLDNIVGDDKKKEPKPIASKTQTTIPIASKPAVDDWGEIQPLKPTGAAPAKNKADALLDDLFGEEKSKVRPKTANIPS